MFPCQKKFICHKTFLVKLLTVHFYFNFGHWSGGGRGANAFLCSVFILGLSQSDSTLLKTNLLYDVMSSNSDSMFEVKKICELNKKWSHVITRHSVCTTVMCLEINLFRGRANSRCFRGETKIACEEQKNL